MAFRSIQTYNLIAATPPRECFGTQAPPLFSTVLGQSGDLSPFVTVRESVVSRSVRRARLAKIAPLIIVPLHLRTEDQYRVVDNVEEGSIVGRAAGIWLVGHGKLSMSGLKSGQVLLAIDGKVKICVFNGRLGGLGIVLTGRCCCSLQNMNVNNKQNTSADRQRTHESMKL